MHKIYTINAFATQSGGGNPAGVVLDADNLTRVQKMTIAAKIGFSETAFVEKSSVADFKVSFFTPNKEVDLCGHATIGTFSLMLNLGLITPGVYTQETLAGVLSIEYDGEYVYMQQNTPIYGETIDKELIAQSLNISVDMLAVDMDIQIISTGLNDIVIPVKSLDILTSIQPNFDLITEVSQKFGVVGYHVYCLETMGKNHTAHCRNFAPLYDILEESATGTSCGALACYLYEKSVSDIDYASMIFEQGYSMGSPSEIRVSLSIEDKDITKVVVGGKGMDIQEIVVAV